MTQLPLIQASDRPDQRPVQAASLDVLDLDRVATHIQQAQERRRYQGTTDPVQYLEEHHCVTRVGDGYLATLAGVLCFAKTPQRFFPGAVVDIGHYLGTETLSHEVLHLEKNLSGTIFDQLEAVESYLWKNSHHGMTIHPGSFQRVEVHEYPQVVIRELCVNMLAHRDYLTYQNAARVTLLRNRIEWNSPGGLPEGITLETLLELQQARNPTIMNILYEGGYVEAFGQGLDTVVAVLRQEGMNEPLFRDLGAAFVVTVYGRLDENLGIVPMERLSDSQREILKYLQIHKEAAMSEILALFDERGKRTVQRDLTALTDANLIERVGQARATRYRLR